MKKRYLAVLLVVFLTALTACSHDPAFTKYGGRHLRIAVVGEPPKVRENQIVFKKIAFSQLAHQKVHGYDAVFVMKNYLLKASELPNKAAFFGHSSIPIFLIDANSHVPFTENGIKYDKRWAWSAGGAYISTIYYSKEEKKLKTSGYGLYNDEKTEPHVEALYSDIFQRIAQKQLYE